MRTGLLLMTCGGACVALALLLGGAGAWALAWTGASILVVAGAYLGPGPRVLGKRVDGSLAWLPVLLLLPYFLLAWTVWHARRALSREHCFHEVAPGLLLGRRPFAHELPPEVALVVDLTSEFAESRAVRTRARYLCHPVLDTCAPDEDVHAAEQHLRRTRPGVKLHPNQRELLERMTPRLMRLAARARPSPPPLESRGG